MATNLKTGEAGINLIKSHESLSLKAYLCPAGKLTIGWGHTAGVQPNEAINEEEAETFLRADLASSEQVVNRVVNVPLTQNQFDALSSFCFNVGNGNFETSTLLKLLNEGKYADAAEQFLVWNHSNGHVLDGLTKRREAERELFLQA